MLRFPRISIITPSYNQGQFIERTIKSVIDQKYPNLEFIIMDGGSTDETPAIVSKYADTLFFESKKDRGQAHAINKGLRKATGDILSYLNSDDTLCPGTLRAVADFFISRPHAQFVYGKGQLIDINDRPIGLYNDYPTNSALLAKECAISQPTCFWTRSLFERIGFFNESYRFTMDYEYWVRTAKEYDLFYLERVLANTRIHPDAKTSSFTHALHREGMRVVQEHYGNIQYDWIFTYTDSGYTKQKNTKDYFRYMVTHAVLNFLWFNHSFPTGRALTILLSWARQAV